MGTSDAYVIIGNSALLKCEVPSFVGDFVSVVNWIDSKGNEHFPTENHSKEKKIYSNGIHKEFSVTLLLCLYSCTSTICV